MKETGRIVKKGDRKEERGREMKRDRS